MVSLIIRGFVDVAGLWTRPLLCAQSFVGSPCQGCDALGSKAKIPVLRNESSVTPAFRKSPPRVLVWDAAMPWSLTDHVSASGGPRTQVISACVKRNVVMFPVEEDGGCLTANQAGLGFTAYPGPPPTPAPGSAGSCSGSCHKPPSGRAVSPAVRIGGWFKLQFPKKNKPTQQLGVTAGICGRQHCSVSAQAALQCSLPRLPLCPNWRSSAAALPGLSSETSLIAARAVFRSTAVSGIGAYCFPVAKP